MGSATRQALEGSRAALGELGRADLKVAEDLLAAERTIGASSQLRAALTDTEADATQKRALAEAVFGSRIAPDAVSLLVGASTSRWSDGQDFLAGIEELAYRVAAESAPDGVDRLLSGKGAPQTLAIVRHLVQEPRGRRIGEMLRHAASVVAHQRGFDIATVTTAVPLTDAQLTRLEQGLAVDGRRIRFDTIVDPSVLGGVRVQIGDDVIDGSVASRLSSLRQKLAG